MNKIFQVLVSTIIVVSMIFTMGVDVIREENPNTEKQIKETEIEVPIEKIEEKPVEVPAEKPIDKKEEKPSEEPVVKPEKKPTEEPTVKPEKKPENPIVEPAEEKPEEKLEEKPEEVPVEEVEKEKPVEEEIEEVEVDVEKTKEEETEKLDPLEIILTDAKTLIEDPIRLGTGNDSNGMNYLDVKGGDEKYTYEWKVVGEDKVFSKEKHPKVHPKENTKYELTLKDSSGNKKSEEMALEVLDPKADITVTAVAGGRSGESFDIFIYGPEESLYTVSLQSGESYTLKGLERGDYRVETIVPMNYKLVGIENDEIRISLDNIDKSSLNDLDKYLKKKTTVNYKRTNSSWFYSR